jgi:tRNA(Arg) A34 adenosine deaminase TadA
MPTADHAFNWSDLAFGSKKPLQDLHATFIAAPREISSRRFSQIVKEYLPKGNIILGLAQESYVLGLEGQPQFSMLQYESVQPIIEKVNKASSKHQIYLLMYAQRDLIYILEKIRFARAIFVNGSWYHGFHLRPEYHVIISQDFSYELISPFADETEAKNYAENTARIALPESGLFSDIEMTNIALQAARQSYDYASFQTASALGRSRGKKYELIATSHNRILPYETYAMHVGSERERYFSPMNDLNHYDTIHFEVAMLVQANQRNIDLTGTTLFASVLPCPHCARMLAATDLAELVYVEDHSSGYAIKLLESAGKKVRRLIP